MRTVPKGADKKKRVKDRKRNEKNVIALFPRKIFRTEHLLRCISGERGADTFVSRSRSIIIILILLSITLNNDTYNVTPTNDKIGNNKNGRTW